MKHAPDVDVLLALDAEHKVWMSLQTAHLQAGQGELMRTARRSRGRPVRDRFASCLQGIDETRRSVPSGLASVAIEGGRHVATRKRARQDRLLAHPALALRARALSPRKLGLVSRRRLPICGAAEQQLAQPLTVLVGPDQLAGIVAARAIAVGWTAWLAPRSASGAILAGSSA